MTEFRNSADNLKKYIATCVRRTSYCDLSVSRDKELRVASYLLGDQKDVAISSI